MPLEFISMHIDHVLPESLLSSPDRLSKIRHEYELPETFGINSYSNWVPAHGICNSRKSDDLFPKGNALYFLHRVNNALPRVHKELAQIRKQQKRDRVTGALCAALESGVVSEDDIWSVLTAAGFYQDPSEPVVVAFGLGGEALIYLLRERPELKTYAELCDVLELELRDSLTRRIPVTFEFAEPPLRTGESLTVRIVFPDLPFSQTGPIDIDALHRAAPDWEILEVSSVADVYGASYSSTFTST